MLLLLTPESNLQCMQARYNQIIKNWIIHEVEQEKRRNEVV